jgi:hypothetical protein
MESTPRLSLPMLVPGQAQKELFHNEALQVLDVLVACAIEEPARNDPPQTPIAGQTFLVGDAPTGEWAQYSGHIAAYAPGGWRYLAPVVGSTVLEKSTGKLVSYGTSGWETGVLRASRLLIEGRQVVGEQAGPIPDPSGGLTVDAEARSVIAEMLSALRQHGLIST